MADRPRYHNGILVYTAQDIHDDVVDGMDPDCLLVSHDKYAALEAERDERRARFERAYMAALGGVCSDPNIEKEVLAVHFAQGVALETVRQWDAMISQLDGEEG